jgi:hypothetical protein
LTANKKLVGKQNRDLEEQKSKSMFKLSIFVLKSTATITGSSEFEHILHLHRPLNAQFFTK